MIQRHTVPVLADLATFIARNLPFVAQVALMGLEMTGLARPNSALVWADPADYQRELAEAVGILVTAGISGADLQPPALRPRPSACGRSRSARSATGRTTTWTSAAPARSATHAAASSQQAATASASTYAQCPDQFTWQPVKGGPCAPAAPRVPGCAREYPVEGAWLRLLTLQPGLVWRCGGSCICARSSCAGAAAPGSWRRRRALPNLLARHHAREDRRRGPPDGEHVQADDQAEAFDLAGDVDDGGTDRPEPRACLGRNSRLSAVRDEFGYVVVKLRHRLVERSEPGSWARASWAR